MSVAEVTNDVSEVLAAARREAQASGIPYAGGVSPPEAWALVEAGQAVLVDVRSSEERVFVGHVPAGLHVAWATGTGLQRNPRFVRELEAKVAKTERILLLCRSGKRSALAAEAAARAGFGEVYNVLEGFEGDLGADQQRGSVNGWRFHGLPWVQE